MELDPETAIRILEPYPELLEYWRSEMRRPDARDHYGSGGVERMHNPSYLREVVRQHRWLLEGPGDYVDPDAAEQIEALLEEWPALRLERDVTVASPWKRAMLGNACLATRWYDPGYVAFRVEARRHPRPYDAPERQHMRELSAAILAGGQITMIDMKTGRATHLDSDAGRFERAPAD